MNAHRATSVLAALSASLVLAACGGGSDGAVIDTDKVETAA